MTIGPLVVSNLTLKVSGAFAVSAAGLSRRLGPAAGFGAGLGAVVWAIAVTPTRIRQEDRRTRRRILISLKKYPPRRTRRTQRKNIILICSVSSVSSVVESFIITEYTELPRRPAPTRRRRE